MTVGWLAVAASIFVALAATAVVLATLFGKPLWRGLGSPSWLRAVNPLEARASRPRQIREGGLWIDDHVLMDGAAPVALRPSPNLSRGNRVRFVILHYTASGTGQSSLRWLGRRWPGVSAHLLIDRDGSVVQLVPFDYQAWHAGKSRWCGERNFNAKSIGIELVNWGPLGRGRDGQWRGHSGVAVPASEVMAEPGGRRGWHLYSARQKAALARILRVLLRRYRIEAVLGHEDISPGRKIDPGPALEWDDLGRRLLPSEGQVLRPDCRNGGSVAFGP